jgi:hypothetical protein
VPRWKARRPDPTPPRLDAELDLAVRAAEVRSRSEATELVLRDRHDPAWARDVRGWLEPVTRLAERT